MTNSRPSAENTRRYVGLGAAHGPYVTRAIGKRIRQVTMTTKDLEAKATCVLARDACHGATEPGAAAAAAAAADVAWLRR